RRVLRGGCGGCIGQARHWTTWGADRTSGRSEWRNRRAANEIAPARRRSGNSGMRCLGIDYGSRRIGLSYGDELGVATPLPALTDADEAQRWTRLTSLIAQRQITDLVLGYPLNMDGTVGFKAKEVEVFSARLQAELKL